MSAPRTARERARAELTREILDAAREHLAASGASQLSLRAIARDLGMASSAIYRYFPSRDALLTALIVEAYDSLGAAVEQAEASAARDDVAGRWRAGTRAARAWALDHPHEYSLIYGSPVPGYVAPSDTIDPAGRVGLALAGILRDAHAAGRLRPMPLADVQQARPMLEGLLALVFVDIDEPRVVGAISAWTTLFGTISFELFGHYENIVVDRAAYFDETMRRAGILAGLDL
ncbi:MAG: TetR/AcrR family transcriptional regulator [Acidimicrobiia bacterium]|nr:TetR/AcrR family transcriptional regulator [Acidimicrobiia bacterium]